MKPRHASCFLTAALLVQSAQALTTGDIAFTSFNADRDADSIANTGLTAGTTAVYLTNSADFADYTDAQNQRQPRETHRFQRHRPAR